jgi:two-component system sensor histidine kinase UhpB
VGIGDQVQAEKFLSEQALRESEERFRELAENIDEVFWVWTADKENVRLLYVSPAYETIWGRSCKSLYSSPRSWREALHREDKERVLAEIAALDLEKANDLIYRIVRPDQSIRWIRDRIFPVRDTGGAVVRFAGIAEDITENEEADEALRRANRQLRILSRRRIEVQEDERRRLSRELHDQIGQLLTAGNINLQSARKAKDRRSIMKKLDETIAILDQILQQVRQISFEIRPPVLDDLGLAPALRWMVDDAAARAGISAQFLADPNLKRADVESETACYRVGLEAVSNVMRHAQAKKVWVQLRNAGNALELIVRDNGVGFDVADAAKRVRRDRLGLVGMRDRAMAVGGQFECNSTPGRGTELRASFPISSALDRIESP